MTYTHEIKGCLAEDVGERGLDNTAWQTALADAEHALEHLRTLKSDKALPLLDLPAARDDLEQMKPVAARFHEYFDDVVVLGTGGSSLGGKTLYALVDQGFGPAAENPRMHFLDNVDPTTFLALDRAVDWERTGVLAISKSGGTAETLTQIMSLFPHLYAVAGPDGVRDQVVCITEPGANPLRNFAERFQLQTLDHDPKVGGRFSALSVTGMLPAMIAGVDVVAVREGAAEVLDQALAATNAEACPPAAGAAAAVGLMRAHGISINVLMPYLDGLADFGLWFRQLWAESLGKNGTGLTPIRAMGAVDQHSQLQLYLGGPADKMFTVIQSACRGTGEDVPADLANDPSLSYLAGRLMGDLMDAMQRATAETLIKNGRPTRVIGIDTLDGRTLGALMMHFMLETIYAAQLLGVDAFDQPAVEEGKVLARQYLSEIPPTEDA